MHRVAVHLPWSIVALAVYPVHLDARVCTGITSTPHAEKEDEYTAYVVEYKQNGVEKAVVKRFSEFFTFDSFLRQRGFCCLPALPSRTLIKLFVDSFVQDRLRQLNEYVELRPNRCLAFLLHTFASVRVHLFRHGCVLTSRLRNECACAYVFSWGRR